MLEGREVNIEKEEVCARELTEKTLEAKEETGCAYRKGIIASSTFWDTGWLLLWSPVADLAEFMLCMCDRAQIPVLPPGH